MRDKMTVTIKNVLAHIARVFPGAIFERYADYYFDIKLGFDRHLVLSENVKEMAATRGHKGIILSLGCGPEGTQSLDISPLYPNYLLLEEWLKDRWEEQRQEIIGLAKTMGTGVSPTVFSSSLRFEDVLGTTTGFIQAGSLTEVQARHQEPASKLGRRMVYDFLTDTSGTVLIITDMGHQEYRNLLASEYPTLGETGPRLAFTFKNPSIKLPKPDLLLVEDPETIKGWHGNPMREPTKIWDTPNSVVAVDGAWEPSLNYPDKQQSVIIVAQEQGFCTTKNRMGVDRREYRYPPTVLDGDLRLSSPQDRVVLSGEENMTEKKNPESNPQPDPEWGLGHDNSVGLDEIDEEFSRNYWKTCKLKKPAKKPTR